MPYEEEWFHWIQTEDDSAFHKPDHRVFEPTLQRLAEIGISAADVVYVGDHRIDHQAATGAGIDFVGVATGLVTVEQFEAAGARAVPSIADLVLAA